jgi:hypothetical protein
MSKLKIEHGASKIRWTLLKTNIEEPIATDIDLICQWSENERKYVINELLRFALGAAQDFQKYKAEHGAGSLGSSSIPQQPPVAIKTVPGSVLKPDVTTKSAGKPE